MPRIGFILAGLLALPLLAPVAAQAQSCEPGKVAERYPGLAGKTIRMGADPQSPPYSYRDEKDLTLMTGSDIDLAKAVFDCVGVKLEVVPGAWSGLLPAVIAGQIDLMFYLYYKPERAQQVDFVDYMKAGTGAMTQMGNPKGIKSQNDLCGKTVAVALGSVEEAQMRDLSTTCTGSGKPAVDVTTFPDNAAGFRLIQSGRADINLNDLALLDHVIQSTPGVFERAYSVVSGLEIGIAIKKGNDELSKATLEGLKAVQASGGQVAVFKKYGIDPSLQIDAVLKTK